MGNCIDWRLARGEAGQNQGIQEGNSFTLTSKEIEAKCFHLEYDCSNDQYSRPVDGSTLDGWQEGVFECDNIKRKEEHDWKMVYLARTEDAEKSSVNWRLDLSGTKLCVKSVELKVTSKVYENGKVIWQLCGGKQCLLPTPGVTLKTEQMAGSKEIKVGANLSGGKGDIAWQHTQLFRTEMGGSEPQLSLIVTLKDDK